TVPPPTVSRPPSATSRPAGTIPAADAPTSSSSTTSATVASTFVVKTTYGTCEALSSPGDRLHAPTITETSDSVVVTFFADPYAVTPDPPNCVPAAVEGTSYTVHLAAAIGTRQLFDSFNDPPTRRWPPYTGAPG